MLTRAGDTWRVRISYVEARDHSFDANALRFPFLFYSGFRIDGTDPIFYMGMRNLL